MFVSGYVNTRAMMYFLNGDLQILNNRLFMAMYKYSEILGASKFIEELYFTICLQWT